MAPLLWSEKNSAAQTHSVPFGCRAQVHSPAHFSIHTGSKEELEHLQDVCKQSRNLKLDPRPLKGIYPSPVHRDICAGSCPAWWGGHLPLGSCKKKKKNITVQPRFLFISRASMLSSFG